MTDKQPEALRLADAFGIPHWTGLPIALHVEAAAELRRLHEVNVELMKALAAALDLPFEDDVAWFEWRDRAEAALAKAQGETAIQRLNKAAEDNGEEL